MRGVRAIGHQVPLRALAWCFGDVILIFFHLFALFNIAFTESVFWPHMTRASFPHIVGSLLGVADVVAHWEFPT